MKIKFFFLYPAFVLALFLAPAAYSQVYTFAKDTIKYRALTGATSIDGGTYWDDEYWPIKIGFNFLGHDTLTVSANGLVSLANYSHLVDQQQVFTISAFADASLGADLINRSISTPAVSPISYKLDSVAPYRILKIEWKNAGFFYDSSATRQDYISFQLWLYEENNKIEMRYGQHYFYNGVQYTGNKSFGPVIGIGFYKYSLSPPGATYNQYTNTGHPIYLSGNANSPSVNSSFTSLTAYDTSSCAPSVKTRYTFTTTGTSVTSVQKAEASGLKIYPNPATSFLHVEFENKSASEISVFDATGNLVYRKSYNQTGQVSEILNTEIFPKGLYILKVESENTYSSRLLSVQ
ncbi:MAG: T9SS type A sorting domain-containing protein [Cytophagaceae bacterium]